MSRIGQGIKKSVLTANSVLYAVTASVPAALSMAASRIVARLAAGNVVAATAAEILTLIGVAAGADVTGDNTPKAHTLDSHSTKAHSELSDAPDGAHHTKFTTTEHTAIGNGAPHHTKYTDSEAKAAAVLAGAITNAETKAPTHDAVYDVKVTADAAQTAAEVDADILTHKNIATAHHTKYTDANARTAAVEDAAYGAGWNGDTTHAPSQNAVYDKIETLGGAAAATGTYTGNDASSRQITTGFQCTFVIIQKRATVGVRTWLMLNPSGFDVLQLTDPDDVTDLPSPYLHASDGFRVTNASQWGANDNGVTYAYYAFG